MELLCIMGKTHNWWPTGSGYFHWTAGDTGSPTPTNAPYMREERCAMCGATRYAPATPATPPNEADRNAVGALTAEQGSRPCG